MSASILTTVQGQQADVAASKPSNNKFDGLPKASPYGDFRDDLIRDGFAVVKGAIPRERADTYADKMFTWLEDLYVSRYLYSKLL
jgi:hypothetical protein